MESALQKIIAAVVGVMIMFIIPVYIAFEKADDISYSLAVKLTQNFVDNVKNKGYISPEMYSDFVSGLYATNNTYDVEIEHVKKRYDPALYVYERVEDVSGEVSKGKLIRVLDYSRYQNAYENGSDITIDVGVYNQLNSSISVTEPSMKQVNGNKIVGKDGPLKDDEGNEITDTDEYNRFIYEKFIEEYKTTGRIVVDKGEVYGDVRRLVGEQFDDAVYIPSVINTTQGQITVVNRQGIEPVTLPYANFRNAYLYSEDGIFWGPTYTNVSDIKGTIFVNGKDYTEEEQQELYDNQILEYLGYGKVILSEGEVYATSDNATGYDEQTDEIRNITIENGKVTVINPEGWEPEELDYEDVISQLRAGNDIEYIEGGIYDASRLKGTISTGSENVVQFDYYEYLDYMLDDSVTEVPITVNYTNNDISFGNDVDVKVTKLNNGYPEVFETSVSNIEELRNIMTSSAVTINGITYTGNVSLDSNENFEEEYEEIVDIYNDNNGNVNIYGEDSSNTSPEGSVATEYKITVILPQMIILDNKLPSSVQETDREIIKQYIENYNQYQNIAYEKTYSKENLSFQREALQIYDEFGNLKYTLYEDLNEQKYEDYLLDFQANSATKVEIESEYVILNDIDIYAEINIDGREEKIIIDGKDDPDIELLEDYYETGRIVISVPEVTTDVTVGYPHVVIRDESGNAIVDIYEKDNQDLYNEYKSQIASNQKVTLKYSISDISFVQANIVINKLYDKNDQSAIESSQTIYDTSGKYNSYLSEYNSKGTITFDGATIYSNLQITDPKITISDLETGRLLEQYKVDYSQIGVSTEWNNIFITKEQQYVNNEQIIDEKITYINGVNCIVEKAHVINEEVITDKQIVAKLFKDTGVSKLEFLRQCMLGNGDMYNSLVYMNENSYIMNEGDQINVTVKNKNQTVASIFYSLFTASVGNEEIAKIYVDYGGTIKNDGDTVLTEESGLVTGELGRLFKYTGQVQEVALSPGKYEIQCWGAAGGYPETFENEAEKDKFDKTKVGKGSYVSAEFNITEETTLYVYVGGRGTKYSEDNVINGGYNGGGNAYNAYGGGGATDVRLLKGNWDDSASLLTRIVVAAGGGGNSKNVNGYGGSGGNLISGKNGERSVDVAVSNRTYTLETKMLLSSTAVPNSTYKGIRNRSA